MRHHLRHVVLVLMMVLLMLLLMTMLSFVVAAAPPSAAPLRVPARRLILCESPLNSAGAGGLGGDRPTRPDRSPEPGCDRCGRTLPLPCGSTAFVATEMLPLLCVSLSPWLRQVPFLAFRRRLAAPR